MTLKLHTIIESEAALAAPRPRTRYAAATVMNIYVPEHVAEVLDEFRRPHALTRSEAITAILRGFFGVDAEAPPRANPRGPFESRADGSTSAPRAGPAD